MTSTLHTEPSEQFGYLQTAGGSASPPLTDNVGGYGKTLLQAIWWISRKWVERAAVHDPYRVRLIDLGLLIDDHVRAGDYSSVAMTDVQTHLCDACRRMNAAPGQCAGQSLHECLLLRAAGS